MADPVDPVPEHLHTVTPRLVFDDAAAAIEFYRAAFGAEKLGEPFAGPDNKIVHAEIRIGDCVVYVTDQGDERDGAAPSSTGGRVTAVMAINVPDVDRLWEQAVEAGAKSSIHWQISSTAIAPGGYATRSAISGCSARTLKTSTARSSTGECRPGPVSRADELDSLETVPPVGVEPTLKRV